MVKILHSGTVRTVLAVVALGLLTAASANAWMVAYNDVVWSAPQPPPLPNVTTICIGNGNPGPTSGVLKDFYTGLNTSITAALTQGGGVNYQPSLDTGGSETNSGTDAYNIFTAVGVKVAGVVYYGSTGWYVDLTLTGLNPLASYEFTTTANRNGPTYANRITKYTISGADSYANTSSSGGAGASTSFCTGLNTGNGYVARWTGIKSGTDASFRVRAEATPSQNSAYAFSVFKLSEIPEPSSLLVLSAGLLFVLRRKTRR